MIKRMNRRVEGLTKEKLLGLAERDDTIVMEAVHDNHFEPWDSDRLGKIVEEIAQFTRDAAEGADIKTLLPKREDMAEFSRLHPVLFEKLCSKEIASNKKHMGVIRFMLETQRSVIRQGMGEQDAMRKVSDFALNSMMSQVETSDD